MLKDAQPPTGGRYRPRNPRASPLYQCVRRHSDDLDAAALVHRPVEAEVLERFLDCGDLHKGFACVFCDQCGLLNGLTKQIVKKVCEANDLGYEERVIKAGEVTNATECFVTSSTREVMPVKSIRLDSKDTIEFPDGGGEMTKNIMRLYTDFTRDYVKAN